MTERAAITAIIAYGVALAWFIAALRLLLTAVESVPLYAVLILLDVALAGATIVFTRATDD